MNEKAASSGGDLNEEEEEEKGHNPPHPNTLKGKKAWIVVSLIWG